MPEAFAARPFTAIPSNETEPVLSDHRRPGDNNIPVADTVICPEALSMTEKGFVI